MKKSEAWSNVTKNRLYVKTEGFLTPEENKAAVDNILKELEKLESDFDFIADLSSSKAATQEGTNEFDRIYHAFVAKGVRRNILIVKDDIARMQLERKARNANYAKEEYAASLEEAERMLDESESP